MHGNTTFVGSPSNNGQVTATINCKQAQLLVYIHYINAKQTFSCFHHLAISSEVPALADKK